MRVSQPGQLPNILTAPTDATRGEQVRRAAHGDPARAYMLTYEFKNALTKFYVNACLLFLLAQILLLISIDAMSVSATWLLPDWLHLPALLLPGLCCLALIPLFCQSDFKDETWIRLGRARYSVLLSSLVAVGAAVLLLVLANTIVLSGDDFTVSASMGFPATTALAPAQQRLVSTIYRQQEAFHRRHGRYPSFRAGASWRHGADLLSAPTGGAVRSLADGQTWVLQLPDRTVVHQYGQRDPATDPKQNIPGFQTAVATVKTHEL